MLVSPTNLLVALRTINNIWQYEYQNQNAQKIADNAAKLYDKFHGFMVDMDKVGKAIESSQKSYDGAMNKLSTGKGNLVRQVEQFRKLGVQSNKKLDENLLDNNED
jgi:DNA recombination protein RmuC